MNKNKNKILNIAFLTALLTVPLTCAYAADITRSEEILTREEKLQLQAQEKNKVYTEIDNSLGSDYREMTIDPQKKELHLKSIGEILDERKQAKILEEEKIKNAPVQEKKEDLIINCAEMEYFEDKSELEARGDVEITTNEGTKAKADKAIYNKEANTIKLINNVVIDKGASTVTGDYMLIDLNEENVLMSKPVTYLGGLIINAQEGYAYSDKIENLNGSVELNKKIELELKSTRFGGFEKSINDKRLVDFSLKKERLKPYKFKTKEIIIRPEKDHDSLMMKNVDIYYNKRKIANVPSIELFTDKEMTYSELNFPPEVGSLKGFGAYMGLGYTFKLPKTYTLRLTPAFVYGQSKAGVGMIGRLKSDKMRIDAGLATNSDGLILDGEYMLTDRLRFDVGRKAYKSEWFNGGTRADHMAELSYDNSYLVRDLGDTIFSHRISAGYFEDYKKRKHGVYRPEHCGFRYRYMAELRKPLASFGSNEQDLYVKLSGIAQGFASVYAQTGDTVGMVRIGPLIESQVKRWHSGIQYTMGGKHGDSPYEFDEYRYGRHTISFDESMILNRFFSFGYKGTITPLKDNRKRDILTENKIYAVVGPDDFKIAFSYDIKRQNIYFDFLILLGSDDLNIKYDKLTVENPDKLGKKEKKQSNKDINRVKVPEDL